MADKIPFRGMDFSEYEIPSPNDVEVDVEQNAKKLPTAVPNKNNMSRVELTRAQISQRSNLELQLTDWLDILSPICMVYSHGEQYIGKRFYEINYRFMGIDEATETVTDNLWAMLRFHYFPVLSDEVFKKIEEIVKTCTKNLATFLTRIAFDDETKKAKKTLKRVPKSAVAFNNGIFDFATNDWLVTYTKIYVESIGNVLVMYDDYVVMWCFDFDFNPLDFGIDLRDIDTCQELLEIFKTYSDGGSQNLCTELMWNMAHDSRDKFSEKRFQHLCEVVGYLLVQSFLQYFVIFIGSGQNGKNSLLDGCLSSRIAPRPVSNSLEEIETDKFVTGSLAGASHNIYLETPAQTYKRSDELKALTGSQYQTVQPKGEKKYSGIINCKYVFAGNDQENIKFSDNTNGFRRRINLFEIYYTWDKDHNFKRRNPDYYNCDFSMDLHEIYGNDENIVAFIYFGMMGVKCATKNFTTDFYFTYNDWNDSYTDYDIGLKDFFEYEVEPSDYIRSMRSTLLPKDIMENSFYDSVRLKPLWLNGEYEWKDNNVDNYQTLSRYFNDKTLIDGGVDNDGNPIEFEELNGINYFNSHDIAISIPYLWTMYKSRKADEITLQAFANNFSKVYKSKCKMYEDDQKKQKIQYILCRLRRGKIVFVER